MGSEYHNEDFDVEAQQAARDAIMEIPLFPDLTVQLRDALEYGPHCDMLQRATPRCKSGGRCTRPTQNGARSAA